MPAAQFDPSQLADIHLPQSIGVWPIAPGWWVLLGLFFLLCLLIYIFSKETKIQKKRITPKQLKRLAVKELSAIEHHYQTADNPHDSIKQLSIFLRRFALSHYHREQVASLADAQWLILLDNMSDPSHQTQLFSSKFSQLLTQAPYQSANTILDTKLINELFSTTTKLVLSYKKSSSRQASEHV